MSGGDAIGTRRRRCLSSLGRSPVETRRTWSVSGDGMRSSVRFSSQRHVTNSTETVHVARDDYITVGNPTYDSNIYL